MQAEDYELAYIRDMGPSHIGHVKCNIEESMLEQGRRIHGASVFSG